MAGPVDAAGLEHLRLLASAIAGRTVDVATAEPGERSWTNGTTIFVDASADASERIQMLSVQASLLAAGSLAAPIVRQLHRRPQVARRYLAVETHRALAANAFLPPVARSLIDAGTASATTTADTSLAMARGRSISEPPTTFGAIHPHRLLATLEREHATIAGSNDVRSELGPSAEIDDEDVGDDKLFSSPVGGGGPIGRLLQRMLRPVRQRGDGRPPGADAPTYLSRIPFATGSRSSVVTRAEGALDASALVEPRRRTYPEWDVHRRQYRPAWCTVVESDAPFGERSTVMAESLPLRRSLARLGVELTPCRRQAQGDDIDIDAAIEAWVDRRAGAPHEDDFYLDTLRRRRDLGVLVLLDVSGSSGEPGIGGRIVHEHQRSAAAALTFALHALGDRVALYAFNSRGRTAVQLLRVKGFADPLDGRVARRLDGLAPAAYTRLGAAIRHGSCVLEERSGTPRRLLVVLSDGFAYDTGYEGRYGEADARRSLLEARRRGVGCLCLSIGADTDPAALRRVFGAAAHATVSHADQLPGLIGPLFRGAVASADVHRQAFQRTTRTRERLEIERSIVGRTPVLRPGR